MAKLVFNRPEPAGPAKLVFNDRPTDRPTKAELVERAHASLDARRDMTDTQKAAINKVSFHIQEAMREIRDDVVGSLEFEKFCGQIYHFLYVAMNIVTAGLTPPPSCLQGDLDDVMGADGPRGDDDATDVPEVPEDSTSTVE